GGDRQARVQRRLHLQARLREWTSSEGARSGTSILEPPPKSSGTDAAGRRPTKARRGRARSHRRWSCSAKLLYQFMTISSSTSLLDRIESGRFEHAIFLSYSLDLLYFEVAVA